MGEGPGHCHSVADCMTAVTRSRASAPCRAEDGEAHAQGDAHGTPIVGRDSGEEETKIRPVDKRATPGAHDRCHRDAVTTSTGSAAPADCQSLRQVSQSSIPLGGHR